MATSEKPNTAERYLLKAKKVARGQERIKTAQQDETRAIDEKTARLRALRLARDAAAKQVVHGKGQKASKTKTAGPGPETQQRKGDR